MFTKAAGSRLHYVNLCGFHCYAEPGATANNHPGSLVEQRRQVQVIDGGDGEGLFEGRERGAEWSRRGRNSAVGCISVSRSDG